MIANIDAIAVKFQNICIARCCYPQSNEGSRRKSPTQPIDNRSGRRQSTIIVAGIGFNEMKPGSGGNLHQFCTGLVQIS
jgi:hypothetical protein